jgi:excisionase family DNA binding protein
MAPYTVKQAAEALGVSPRTLRRRLEAGDLSCARVLRGAQEVTTIDGAELARFAQGHGYTLRQPGAPAVDTEEQTVADEGQVVATAPGVDGGKHEQTVADEGQTGASEGQTVASDGAAQVAPVAPGAAQIAALEARLQAAESERDFLRRIVEDLAEALQVKALPPMLQAETMPQAQAPAQRPRSWWRRLWGSGE